MTMVYCDNTGCPLRKGKGVCTALVVYHDGRYCSEFGFKDGTVHPIFTENGYEGFTVSKEEFIPPESFDGKCPECKNRAVKVTSNIYRCLEDSCDVVRFKVSSSGSTYDIEKEVIETKHVRTREELNDILSRNIDIVPNQADSDRRRKQSDL